MQILGRVPLLEFGWNLFSLATGFICGSIFTAVLITAVMAAKD